MSTKAGRPKTPNKQNQKKQGQQNQQKQAQQFPQSPQPRPTVQAAPSHTQLDQAAKREARLDRQAAARAAGERRRRKQTIQRYAIITAVLIVVLGGATALLMNELNKPGELITLQISEPHLKPGQPPPAYNTDPPTSGVHAESRAEFKVHSVPITKELQLHALEDGGVAINYQPDLDKATVDMLATLTSSYLERTGGRGNILMAPYPGLSHPIVITAWRRIDRLETYDEARIRRFVDAYVGIDHHPGREGQRLP